MDEARSNPRHAQSIGINDELINGLVKSSGMPIEDVRAIRDWSVIVLNDGLKKTSIEFKHMTGNAELLNMMIHALALERRRTSRLLQS